MPCEVITLIKFWTDERKGGWTDKRKHTASSPLIQRHKDVLPVDIQHLTLLYPHVPLHRIVGKGGWWWCIPAWTRWSHPDLQRCRRWPGGGGAGWDSLAAGAARACPGAAAGAWHLGWWWGVVPQLPSRCHWRWLRHMGQTGWALMGRRHDNKWYEMS